MKALLCIVSGLLALVFAASMAQDTNVLRVPSSNGVRAVLEYRLSALEETADSRIDFDFSTARTLRDKLVSGAGFDVAILTPALNDELGTEGLIRPDSRVRFARVGIGVGVRPGFAADSVSTPDDVRRVLLDADSVAYGASGQSRRTNEAAFEALGIMPDIQPKIRLTGPGEAPLLVAAGEVDVVLTLISELKREPGLRYLGPLPTALQGYIEFEAAMAVDVRNLVAARALLDALRSAELADALHDFGLEPVAP